MPKDLTIEERVRLAASRYGKEAPSFDDVLAAITRDYGKDAHHTMLWHDLAKEAQAIPPSIKLDFKVCGHLLHHRGTCKCKGTVYTNRSSSPDKDTINDIVARYEAGDGLRDLAKDFGIAASRIRRYLKTRGVEVREQQDKRSQQPFCISEQVHQNVGSYLCRRWLRRADVPLDVQILRHRVPRTGSQWLRVPIASGGVYILNPLHL